MSSNDSGRAIVLYAVGARDPSDFIDMIREPETTDGALQLLHDMLASPGTKKTDVELNQLLLPMVVREIARRKT